MDFIALPSGHHHQQEQPPIPQGQGTMDATPIPEPPQPHQQEQPPPLHGHGTMETTITPQTPQPPGSHQQERPYSNMSPAKIIFHQPQQQRKRGRPRKYSADGLGLSPTPSSKVIGAASSRKISKKAGGTTTSSKTKQQLPDLDTDAGCASGVTGVAAFKNPSKKPLGRQPCSKKKQESLDGVGVGWKPHISHVHIGEDIAAKVLAFSQKGPRPLIVSIISATGVVCDVKLRQSAIDDSTTTYEGNFFIISLSGSLLLSESNGSPSIAGGLSLSMSGPDHKILCGIVSGKLKAASPVQLVMGSFIPKKEKPMSEALSSTPHSNVSNFDATVTDVTPPSQNASSHLADENSGSPLSHK